MNDLLSHATMFFDAVFFFLELLSQQVDSIPHQIEVVLNMAVLLTDFGRAMGGSTAETGSFFGELCLIHTH